MITNNIVFDCKVNKSFLIKFSFFIEISILFLNFATEYGFLYHLK